MITKFDKLIINYFQTKKLCGASITKFLFVYKEIDLFLDDFLIKHPECFIAKRRNSRNI